MKYPPTWFVNALCFIPHFKDLFLSLPDWIFIIPYVIVAFVKHCNQSATMRSGKKGLGKRHGPARLQHEQRAIHSPSVGDHFQTKTRHVIELGVRFTSSNRTQKNSLLGWLCFTNRLQRLLRFRPHHSNNIVLHCHIIVIVIIVSHCRTLFGKLFRKYCSALVLRFVQTVSIASIASLARGAFEAPTATFFLPNPRIHHDRFPVRFSPGLQLRKF